jgi:hypothetical protein
LNLIATSRPWPTDHLGTWSGPCPIQFGYNGSPFYIQGPYDDVESIAHTLADNPAVDRLPVAVGLGFEDADAAAQCQ